MRAAFIRPGGPKVPDLHKVGQYRITRLYWQANDPQLDAGLLDSIRNYGLEVGVMRGPTWDNASAHDLARELDADLVRLGSDNKQCAVLADVEYHDPAYVLAFIQEWRALRPRRATAWTLEPYQAGWITDELVAAIRSSNITVIPQGYYGDMKPVASVDDMRCELLERGVPCSQLQVFYAAAKILNHWDGIAFTYTDLP